MVGRAQGCGEQELGEGESDRLKGASVQRSDWIVIEIVLVLDAAGITAIALITLLAGPVWLEFVLVLAMFIVTLLGAYWVLFAPEDIPKEHGGDDERE